MEDNDIIELYWKRCEEAITETERKYGRSLHNISYKILYNKEDSEECVMDTYHVAWNSLPPKRPEYFFAYLAKILRNACFGKLDYKCAKKRNTIVVELGEELENCIAAPDEYEKRMDSAEIGKVISDFLHSKEEIIRIVFVRRYWYMDSVKQIGERFGMTESKVKSLLFRTRKELKKHFDREGVSI